MHEQRAPVAPVSVIFTRTVEFELAVRRRALTTRSVGVGAAPPPAGGCGGVRDSPDPAVLGCGDAGCCGLIWVTSG